MDDELFVFITCINIFPHFRCVSHAARNIHEFFDYNITSFEFIGWDNYVTLYHDKTFHKSMINTIVLVAVAVPIVIGFSIFVAMSIYKKSEFIRSFCRGIFYLPAVTSVVSVTVVWGWIYHPNFGILNYITSFLE